MNDIELTGKGALVVLIVWIIGTLVSLAILVGVIYVAVHFISMYW